MVHRKLFRAFVAILTTATVLASASATSSASPNQRYDIVLDGEAVAVHASDLSSPEAVERLLLRIEQVQDSTDLSFIDSAPEAVREAVITTITRGEETATERTGVYAPAETAEIASSLGINATALASYTCGWGYKQVRYKPGLITYYTFSLKTNFCWNGSQVQSTPIQQVNGSGSWGWAYTGCSNCYVIGWPAPTTYKSYAQGRMNLGTGVDHDRYPYVQHIVDKNGWVSTTSHD